jgi:hypothetical protein
MFMETLQLEVVSESNQHTADLLTCMVCATQYPSTRTYGELDDVIPVCTDQCRRLLSARLTTVRNMSRL